MNQSVRNATAVIDVGLLDPRLYESYALEKEGPMTDTDKQILDGLRDLTLAVNGTNGNKGILTRLALVEDKTGDRAIFVRQIKAGAILAVISAAIAFGAARITFQQTPTKDDTEKRIQKLEAELSQTREALKDKEDAVRVLIEQQTPRQPSRRPSRPVGRPHPPLMNLLRENDLWATQDGAFPVPVFGYNHIPIPPMEFPK